MEIADEFILRIKPHGLPCGCSAPEADELQATLL